MGRGTGGSGRGGVVIDGVEFPAGTRVIVERTAFGTRELLEINGTVLGPKSLAIANQRSRIEQQARMAELDRQYAIRRRNFDEANAITAAADARRLEQVRARNQRRREREQ